MNNALLFAIGVVLGVLVSFSVVSRVSPVLVPPGPSSSTRQRRDPAKAPALGDSSLSSLLNRGRHIWNSIADANIRIVVQDGLRVVQSSVTPSLLISESAAPESGASPAEFAGIPPTGEREMPVKVDQKESQTGNQEGAIQSLIDNLRTFNGWGSAPSPPTVTTRLDVPNSPAKRWHAADHSSEVAALSEEVSWTPGRPGQFVKAVQAAQLPKTKPEAPVTKTKQQRPETKRGKEKYEPELGLKAIGAGIPDTPDKSSLTSPIAFKSLANATSLSDPPPLVPYHEQYKFLNQIYIPSLASVSARRQRVSTNPTSSSESGSSLLSPKALPDMSQQKGIFEHENLKLHLCNAVFEAYSASYLTTKAHMISVKSETFNLTWVNCEMASFIHMRDSRAFYKNPQGSGMIMQSLDVLDFSVIHLSAFERSSRKYRAELWKSKADQKVQWAKIDAVIAAGAALESRISPLKTLRNITYSPEARRTVVVMPFLGGAMGAGHSELGNRFEYLKACFWSFYEFIPNIVAGVTRQEDVDWSRERSGLPFHDVILLPKLPKAAGLPVGLTQQIKQRLVDGRYDFDYIFFTESDQILISRQLQVMFHHLQIYPHRMLLPHRLMPYSDRVIKEVHKKTVDVGANKWMQQSCCLPRQNCQERKTWQPLSHQSIPVINYYGLYVPLGNVNFLMESYRGCTIGPYVNDYCP